MKKDKPFEAVILDVKCQAAIGVYLRRIQYLSPLVKGKAGDISMYKANKILLAYWQDKAGLLTPEMDAAIQADFIRSTNTPERRKQIKKHLASLTNENLDADEIRYGELLLDDRVPWRTYAERENADKKRDIDYLEQHLQARIEDGIFKIKDMKAALQVLILREMSGTVESAHIQLIKKIEVNLPDWRERLETWLGTGLFEEQVLEQFGILFSEALDDIISLFQPAEMYAEASSNTGSLPFDGPLAHVPDYVWDEPGRHC